MTYNIMNKDEMTDFLISQRKVNKKMFNEFLRLELKINNIRKGGPLNIMSLNYNNSNSVGIDEKVSQEERNKIKMFSYDDILKDLNTQIETNKILMNLVSETKREINKLRKNIII